LGNVLYIFLLGGLGLGCGWLGAGVGLFGPGVGFLGIHVCRLRIEPVFFFLIGRFFVGIIFSICIIIACTKSAICLVNTIFSRKNLSYLIICSIIIKYKL